MGHEYTHSYKKDWEKNFIVGDPVRCSASTAGLLKLIRR